MRQKAVQRSVAASLTAFLALWTADSKVVLCVPPARRIMARTERPRTLRLSILQSATLSRDTFSSGRGRITEDILSVLRQTNSDEELRLDGGIASTREVTNQYALNTRA
jgi:hypothetical protein